MSTEKTTEKRPEKRTVVREAKFVASASDMEHLPAPTLAEVAFAGRSNVGKSSLLNALMERKGLVRTSRTPGCTRGINLFEAEVLDGPRLHLVDLPGYGFARRSKAEKSTWGTLIERYLRERGAITLVVILVDVRRGLEDDDRALIEFLRGVRPAVLVATKLDKLPRNARIPAVATVRAAAGTRVIGFSAETGEGREALWKAITT